MDRGNKVSILWVPTPLGVAGNEAADRLAKKAAGGQIRDVSDDYRWEASLSHLSLAASENRARATARWISTHVKPERRYSSSPGTGFRRRQLRRVRKPLASRYYQLLTGACRNRLFPSRGNDWPSAGGVERVLVV